MKVLTAVAGTAVAAALLSAAPAQAQFFDAPAAIAGGILGTTAGVVGAATGGVLGTPYYGNGYGYGYNTYPASSYYYGNGYGPGYANDGFFGGTGLFGTGLFGGNAYAPSYGYGYYPAQPTYSGRAVYNPHHYSYRTYRRSWENPYN